jgi:CheY-like chemotaxis protein/HPt (histidine-containing phosphotransfer) domain-containing protein
LFDCLATLTAESHRDDPPTQTLVAHLGTPKVSGERSDHVRILLAEDNIVNQKVALRQLEHLGYAADAVANGIEVLEALERIPYDVVLMDCQMPEMDGYEATRQIREREGDSRRTPIIAMTANALEGDRERCLEAGMDDYISKPVKRETLSAAIERWVERKAGGADSDGSEGFRSIDAGSVSVIDPGVIEELRGLQSPADPGFFNHLIDLFIEETPHRLAAIRTAIESSNQDALAHEAHALKGSSAHLGATRMDALCEILEAQGRAGSIGGAGAMLSVLEEEFARVRSALEAERN